MKRLLIILSTLTTLTLINNVYLNFINNSNVTNKLNSKFDNQQKVGSLYNNKFGALNQDSWITNQSISDHQFYSYDTSALASYTFANARDAFLVDTNGNLVANPDVKIPKQDQIDINNTQQEMITHKKVTVMQSILNPYSESNVANNYFTGGFTDWKYIQMGSDENHIDISKQDSSGKVENNNNLTESLGLYYISKAVINNKITETVADNLGKYFIGQSTLKNKVDDSLINKIINLVIKNNAIFNFICQNPMTVNTENYSMNYIFDHSNNLIEIYYNKWDRNNINSNINYSHYDSFNGTQSNSNGLSSTITIMNNWNNYDIDWAHFVKNFPIIEFNADNLLQVYSQYYNVQLSGGQLNFNTNRITNEFKDISIGWDSNIGFVIGDSASIWHVMTPMHDGGLFGAESQLGCYFMIWHDNQNIYLKYHWFEVSYSATQGCVVNVKLTNCTFDRS